MLCFARIITFKGHFNLGSKKGYACIKISEAGRRIGRYKQGQFCSSSRNKENTVDFIIFIDITGDLPVCIKAVVAAVGLPLDAAARGAASMEHFVQVEVSRGTAAGQIGQLDIGHH